MQYYLVFAIFVSFWVKGIAGFANSLIFSSIMSFRTDTVNISPFDLLLNMPANWFFVWKERKSISLRVCLPLTALMLAGDIPGALWLAAGDATSIKIVFGFVVIGAAVEMYLRERNPSTRPASRVVLVVVGLLAGVSAGIFGISVLLAAYAARTSKNVEAFRGNLCAVFCVDNLFRLWLYSVTGVMTMEVFKSAVLMFPVMVLGLACGVLSERFVSERMVKKVVIYLLFLSGIMLIVTNVM